MKTVRDIMNREVEIIQPASTAREAAEKMKLHDLGSLPVCEGGRILGVVTERQLTRRVIADGLPSRTPVRDIMDSAVALAAEGESAARVMRAMEEARTHQVFVVDKEGLLIGIVSLGKLARTGDEAMAGRVVRRISRPRKTFAVARRGNRP
jgi:CBS domain-containing protein